MPVCGGRSCAGNGFGYVPGSRFGRPIDVRDPICQIMEREADLAISEIDRKFSVRSYSLSTSPQAGGYFLRV